MARPLYLVTRWLPRPVALPGCVIYPAGLSWGGRMLAGKAKD